jgi:hypothetical protein
MPFTSFTPSTQIKSADMNTNFTNAVHLTDTQKVTNKVSVPATASYTPAGAATATLDLSTATIHEITMPAGNITIALSNPTVNQPFIIRILQDGGGSRTVTWFTTIKWSGGSAPVLTTTGSKADVFGFICISAGNYDGYIIGQAL